MYKVCLVDDEVKNYRLFEKLVNWEEKGFQIVGTAADGLEALQLYEQMHPDLIFMDIQLPLMDGLECVRCIREADKEVQIVIVSAYGEFNYAQKAIRYGVQEFLLKPVSRIMLNQLVDKLKVILDERKSGGSDQDIFDNELADRMRMEFAEYKEKGKIPCFLQEDMAVIRIFFTKNQKMTAREKYCKELLHGITKGNSIRGAVITEDSLYAAVAGEECVHTARMLHEELEQQEKGAEVYYLDKLRDGEAEPDCWKVLMTGEAEPDCWKALMTVENYGFYDGGSLCCRIGERSFTEYEIDIDSLDSLIVRSLARGNVQELLDFAGKVYARAEQQRLNPKILKNFTLDFLVKVKFCLKKLDAEKSFAVLRSVKMENIYKVYSVTELKEFYENKIREVFESLDKWMDIKGKNASVVLRANAIAELYYDKQSFSVQDVIEQIGISKNYFTSLYKEKAGIGFWEYVTQLRMEKAKEKLLMSDDTVAAIAQETGYENEYYFSRKFKEYTGMSPKQFRQKGGV